jgi:cytochrome P450
VDRISFRAIDARLNCEEAQTDLLSILLRNMDRADVRDQVLTLLFAGRETVANALSWTWYLLSQHPDSAAQFHAEIDRVLGKRLPAVDDIPHLHHTRMIFAESLRLYPTAWLTTRRAIDACSVGGVRVPAGGVTLMCQYVMHRDPRYYRAPDHFDPTRWTLETQPECARYAYFPFGAGPRQCIGESFAWLEATLILAALAQRWRLRLARGHVVKALPATSLQLKHGLPMVIEPR